jgi:hypothetical protein
MYINGLMSSEFLCRVVFGSYFALFAIWLALYAIACWVNREIGRGLLWLLPAALCAAGAIWAFFHLEDFGLSAGIIGLVFLLALVFEVGRRLMSSLKKYDGCKP